MEKAKEKKLSDKELKEKEAQDLKEKEELIKKYSIVLTKEERLNILDVCNVAVKAVGLEGNTMEIVSSIKNKLLNTLPKEDLQG